MVQVLCAAQFKEHLVIRPKTLPMKQARFSKEHAAQEGTGSMSKILRDDSDDTRHALDFSRDPDLLLLSTAAV